jgi:hypothetical protein
MDQSLTSYFMTQGPFAVLFLLLLGWVLKENAKREERLISSLDRITERLNGVDTKVSVLSHDVGEIKEKLGGR